LASVVTAARSAATSTSSFSSAVSAPLPWFASSARHVVVAFE
jgi:hypothetical protein